jgi:hypothetical protein
MLFCGFSKSKWSSSLKTIGIGRQEGRARVCSTIVVMRAGSLTPLP